MGRQPMYNEGMLTLPEARARILALARKPVGEDVPVHEADGRVLHEDLIAPADLPEFDASMMDGYAVRAEDVAAGAQLPVVGESKTGLPSNVALAPRTACRIFTGAVMPEGANAVVMQEEVERREDVAAFSAAARLGQHVRKRGEDLAHGAVAIARGTRLGPAHLSLASTMERTRLSVAQRPHVIVLPTGDELRDPGAPKTLGSIAESNGIAIATMAKRCGAVGEIARRTKDARDDVRRAITEALERCDVLVTIGGVSVGDHDVVRPALEAAGVSLDFWRVAIKPGKPVCVGSKGERVVLGLPGNPASAMVTFALFGVPLLRALQGDREPWPSPVAMRLAHQHERKPGRLELARAIARGAEVSVVKHQASGSALGVANANAFIAFGADAARLDAGAIVDVFPFSEIGL